MERGGRLGLPLILQSLLLSKDDLTSETLIEVLLQFGVVVCRANAIDIAMIRLSEERFDQVIVDFDDREAATELLEGCRHLLSGGHKPPVTVALLQDTAQIGSVLGAGAHFILTKPVDHAKAQSTFRAATALVKRERQQSLRVAVQAEISIRPAGNGNADGDLVEGILLDLSAGGMGVLAAKPFPPAAQVEVSFTLPEGGATIAGASEVVWSSPNGQTGLRFLDLDAKMRQEMEEWVTSHSQEDRPEEPEVIRQCKLTDLSLGGCYIETESPFPESSAVDLCLRVAGMEIHTEGLVRVMHPGHGMGVEFLARTAEQHKSVGEFINCLMDRPGVTPELETSPRSLVASAADLSRTSAPGGESEDALLNLLRTGHALDEKEFLEELHRQRNPESVAQSV
jgi:CheY-like chemotaxis protein